MAEETTPQESTPQEITPQESTPEETVTTATKPQQIPPQKTRMTFWNIILIVILVMAVIGLCAVGFYLISQLGSSDEGSLPLPVETATESAPAGLCLIDNRLIVGTSADYPPFESFTNRFTLDGFDIALMKDISARIGLQLEFRNIAFEGLGGALQLNQINAAISAISVTPEREQQFAFSDIYWIGSEGILGQPGVEMAPITQVEQLIGQRIGVQSGSVYQKWAQTTLVDTGLIPQSSLYSYVTIDLAVNDLITQNLDLVILDAGPANKFAEQGSASLVGEGLSQQRYAIGLRPECTELRQAINQALVQSQNDGTLSALAQQYLNLQPDEIQPVPTPLPPTPIPTAAPVIPTATSQPTACIDGLALVKDLTYPDNNMTTPAQLPPGTPFQKGWRIRNTGTCTWDNRYFLSYATGNSPYARMGGQETSIIGTVQPGATYDLYLNLVAPVVPGVYQGWWQMVNPQFQPFGERLSVGIVVPPNNPATPTPAPDAPTVYRFVVNPTQIQVGQCVQIGWEVYGNVSGVNIFRNGNPIWVDGPSIGTLQDCPVEAGQVAYEIQANGPGGTARADQFVTVLEETPPTATPAPQPPPQIFTFNVQPASILLSECVNIDWSIGGTLDDVRLLRDGQTILDGAPNMLQISDCPTRAGQVVYRLEAVGAGQTDSEERSVSVSELPPTPAPPPFVGILWELLELSNGQGGTMPVIEGSLITAFFDQAGNIEGNAGCNDYRGRYTASGDSITAVVDLGTMMSCVDPAGVMEQESNYLFLLQAARGYAFNGGSLVLYGPDGQVNLLFVPSAQPR